MRFTLGICAALVVGASALPQNSNPTEPFDWNSTCSGIEGKTKESWQESSLGEWFVVMANAEDVYEKDIQKTIQSWQAGDSSLYGFYCSPMSHCNANFNENDCRDEKNPSRPRFYFLLWSIANLNNWMKSLLDAVANTASIADGMSARLVDDFSSNDGGAALSSAGASLAGGALGSLAAIFPAAAGAAGFSGGLASIAGGIVTLVSEKRTIDPEPKFSDFTKVTEYIAGASETMQKSIEAYTKWLLTEVPSNDRSNGVFYVDDPKSLPNILLDGDFAEPRISENLPNGIFVSLYSAAISILWKAESAAIVKVPHDTPILSTPACEDDGLFADNKWCDDEGNAYLLLHWQMFPKPFHHYHELIDQFKDLKGVDKLEDYKLNMETVVKASEHAASLNGGDPYYEWTTERVVDHLRNDDQNMVQFSGFNLPVCYIDREEVAKGDCDGECQILFALLDCFPDSEYTEFGIGQIDLECREYECNAGE